MTLFLAHIVRGLAMAGWAELGGDPTIVGPVEWVHIGVKAAIRTVIIAAMFKWRKRGSI